MIPRMRRSEDQAPTARFHLFSGLSTQSRPRHPGRPGTAPPSRTQPCSHRTTPSQPRTPSPAGPAHTRGTSGGRAIRGNHRVSSPGSAGLPPARPQSQDSGLLGCPAEDRGFSGEKTSSDVGRTKVKAVCFSLPVVALPQHPETTSTCQPPTAICSAPQSLPSLTPTGLFKTQLKQHLLLEDFLHTAPSPTPAPCHTTNCPYSRVFC
ncbi:leucine-rich repeat extensin-like protein 5 [Panthera tigris]|uniref:leucine-rich repeat extensin-like protein 5 n=1 Tax=Panthera tigris TaxID=9694 RepID=UPI001C6FA333|nr:leucine-rich repeat extensin-like protein 5 [Panthera tigris]